LFMGQEYGDPAPFPYFVSHSDEKLIAAVRRGRKRDFASFAWRGTPPDPQSESTFASARLDWSLREQEPQRSLLAFHRELLALRRRLYATSEAPGHQSPGPAPMVRAVPVPEIYADEESRTLVLHGETLDVNWVAMFHLRDHAARAHIEFPAGTWTTILDANESRWGGDDNVRSPIHSDGKATIDLHAWGVSILRQM